ncbi:hypothetical protein AB0F17_59580 [Nonomuraea sp. NPDC026600]|uniref:hypothetical protein n=1 Tax=Nonomuraea sp. NPDC026600 TaxID=3155363 RepID=UPI0033FB3B23
MPGPIPARKPTPAPTLDAALALWDGLTGEERRNIYRELWLAIQALQNKGDSAPVLEFAERLQVSVRIESLQPGIHALFRESLARGPAAEHEPVDVADVIQLLRDPAPAQPSTTEPTS